MKKFIIALCLLDAHGIMFASQQQKKPTLSMVQEINNTGVCKISERSDLDKIIE